MRDFADIRDELGLKPFLESDNGDLFFTPVAPGKERLLVRRFNRDLPDELIPSYVDLLAAAQAWIDADPDLAEFVRVEQPREVGSDFIARPHHLGDSLRSLLDPATDGEPPELPDELEPMQDRFRLRSDAGPREALLKSILARSLLEPTAKTLYSYGEGRFVVADVKPTRTELERWAAIA